MLWLVLLSAVASVTFAVPKVRSTLPELDERIIGGEPVNIENYPYQLSLQYNGRHFCGAVIISNSIALTAAHCTAGTPSSALSVRANSSMHASGGQVVNVAQIRQHPQYDAFSIDYDISVLILSDSITLGPGAQPIALPSDNEEFSAGTKCIVSGWGVITVEGSSPSNQLQAVEVPIANLEACKDVYGDTGITERMICAGFVAGGKDACKGDSGGPLVSGGKLVGLVSWGYICAEPGYPGVYTNISNLRGYIREVSSI